MKLRLMKYDTNEVMVEALSLTVGDPLLHSNHVEQESTENKCRNQIAYRP